MTLKLTKQQEELWYAYKLNPYADNYNIAISYQVRGNLDRDKFAAIYQTIGNYFEAFKTRFIEKDGEANQIILDRFDGDVIYQELYHSTQDEILAALEQLRAKPFDLEKDWLFRAILIKTDHDQYYFQFVWHHIISDGLTTTIFSQVFEKLYNEGLDAITQFQTYQLADYLDYEEEIIAKSKKETIDYWQHYLQGCNQNDLVKYNHDDTGQINRKRVNIDPKILSKLLKTHKTTPFIFFNALISTFVLRCFHLNDLVVSYPKNIRPTEFSKIVGYFVSMFPMQIQLSGEMTFAELLKKIYEQYQQNKPYQIIPFEEIKESLDIDFSPNVSVVETYLLSQEIELSGIELESKNFFYGGKLNTLFFAYDKTSMVYEVSYDTTYIPDYFIQYLEMLLKTVIADSDQPLCHYELIPPEQKKRILYDWNKTDKPYPKGKTIYQLFEEQVEKAPNNVAVVFEDQQLKYAELNAKANQLAKYLRSLTEIKPDTLIALCLDKSLEMIIGIVGILKAGAAYVPIDPSYPDERIRYILNDTRASLLLTQSHYLSRLKMMTNSQLIPLDSNSYKGFPFDNLLSQNTSHDLAYVIYTSGTTGNPKGTLITHKSLVNRLLWQQSEYHFNSSDKILQKTPYGFDVSVWELLLPLLCGAQLVFTKPDNHKYPQYLHILIKQVGITKLHFVPSMLQLYLDHVEQLSVTERLLNSVTDVFCSGEALPHQISRRFKTLYPSICLNNLYGPTEATIDVSAYNDIRSTETIIPIGKPIQNTKLYVLDKYKQVVPMGVVGELYIGGNGVASGYLNQPELTAEKFVENPFADEEDKINGYDQLYKTGDLVRWLSNGNLEYLGRNDTQIKINGLRIEIGEIENNLLNFKGIRQACVLGNKKDKNNLGNKFYLTAYYVSKNPIDENELISHLIKVLPDYMIPNAFIHMKKFPLTINGKLDKKAFPVSLFKTNKHSFTAPRNSIENQLCKIWQDVLELKQIGIDDDFFRIGGDSILSIRVVSKAKHLGINISVRDIFIYRTINKIVKKAKLYNIPSNDIYYPLSLIDKAGQKQVLQNSGLLYEDIEDIYPVSYLQKGMFFEQERSNNDGTYHDVFSYQINDNLDCVKIINVFEDLIRKHSLLRTSFVKDKTYGYVAIQHKHGAKVKDKVNIYLHDAFDKYFVEERYNAFKINEVGLFRVIITSILPNSFKLIFSFHHAISDGWSITSLISEFTTAYIDNKKIELDELPYYGEFVSNEQNAITDKSNVKFWQKYFDDSQFLTVNLKLNNSLMFTNNLNTQFFKLNDTQNKIIFNIAQKFNIPINLVFLALYQILVSTFTANQEVIVGLVVNNRLEKTGGDKLFGLHLNTIPIKQNIINQSIQALIDETRRNQELINLYKIYPYGKIKSDLLQEDDLYQFAFNYVHFHSIEEQYQNRKIEEYKRFEKTNIPFVLNIFRQGNEFTVELLGHNYFIDRQTITKLKRYFLYYINQCGNIDNNKTLAKIPEAELHKIIHQWNKTDKPYPKDKTIYQLFEEQVEKAPNNVAVVFEDQQLKYAELNAKANQLAKYLRSLAEIKPDTLIALCLDKSLEIIIGILGILKSGAAYVPIDPSYPDERIRYILDDTQVS
ncbi:non-ribosomal peptide synthetase, partial [Fastidiosibacter lacustris]|uniref:non-ribosomal peptide synthetase n=1 Tax=Fastidiosibacter lacustris TaxID=2056695 RepID=UPI000E352E34